MSNVSISVAETTQEIVLTIVGGGLTTILRTTSSPVNTKGDLYTYSTEDARLAVGSNGQLLQADSSETTGLKWASVAGTGDVTAAAVLVDDTIIVGDGGAKGVKDSSATITDITNNSAKTSNATHSGDATGATALTLATVNSNVGSFTASNITVNAKGLITAASSGAGGGDVTGPASAVDENITVFDSTTGKLIKDSGTNISAVTANTAKVTNATHSGDVTGDTALTIGADKVKDTHVDWGTGAGQVSAVDVPIADSGAIITATEVEGALQENRTAINLNTSKTTNANHTGDATGATALTIAADAVTYAKMQNVVADDRILGNIAGAGQVVAELTAAEVRTMINVADGSTANAGTVTSVAAGNGLDFTSITSSGSAVLGTPGTLTSATSDAVTSTSHTHAITTGIADTNIVKVDSASAADDEYARFTAAGLESRSVAETKTDLGFITDVVDDTTPQLGGDVDMNSNGFMLVSQTVGGSDDEAVYLSGSATWSQTDADAEATATKQVGIRISATTVLTYGPYTTSGLTAGSTYYLSTTAGAITTTAPSGSGDIVRIIGYANSTTELFVDPSKSWVEIA